MKPIFCGNFEYDTRQSEIERLFLKFGRVERVDMKPANRGLFPASTYSTGYAFVYMEDDRDAEEAIRALHLSEFGRQRRRLCVEWAKRRMQGDGSIKRREDTRRSLTRNRPTKTLFVVNFDPVHTRVRDLERHFEPYGRLVRTQIRKNFAFVQYETQEGATRALEHTNMSKLDKRIIIVEYAAREDGIPAGGYRRGRSPSPNRFGDRGNARYRSRSPPRRYRSRSPDYGPYSHRASPPRRVQSRSPDYGPYPPRR